MSENGGDGGKRWRRGADHTPAPNVWRYVWLMSGWRQIGLAALALGAAGLNLAPIELQRRMIDDGVAEGDERLLLTLGAIYAASVALHQGVKFGLIYYQAAVAERVAAYTRRHLLFLRASQPDDDKKPGEAVSILNAEVDKLSGFVGGAPSAAVRDVATLAGVLAYMLWTAPSIAAVAVALIAPQALLAPLIQRKLNALVEKRVSLLRAFSDDVAEHGEGGAEMDAQIGAILKNRLSFARLKAALKSLLNLLNGAAPLAIILFGGWMVIRGETSIGVVVAFVSGLDRIASPLRGLIGFYRMAARANVQHAMIARWMRTLG